jgi:NTE family protein
LKRALLVVCTAALTVAAASRGDAQGARPRIGVAFGGGSARGIAHIGVIAWFEQNRIPIDLVAGTSMGGLIGGSFASGMSPDELKTMIATIDWDVMFGSSSFPFKNVRRKDDARSYPSRLEFGLKGGIVPPTALNDGQQVDLLLAAIASGYYGVDKFADLPTPFCAVAVDIRKAERVVLDSGSLAQAMRATMSLPGIFPPVIMGDRVLVDGGALDNIPADVVRDMGADVVIAVDVGYAPSSSVDYSLFGLMGSTLDSMMRANTRRALQSADQIIAIDVEGFGSLDWRRGADLIERGYQSAEKMRAELIKYQVSEADYQAWQAQRASRVRRTLPAPTFVSTGGLAPTDATQVRRDLEKYVGKPLDVAALNKDLAIYSGLDRYQGVTWQLAGPPGEEGLVVRARDKPYAPPFMMLTVNIANTTSNDYNFQIGARYLSFDVFGSGSELRIDGAIGSDPHIGASVYRPLFKSRLFVRPYAGFERSTLNIVGDDVVLAQYQQTTSILGLDFGVNTSRISELSAGVRYGHSDASIRTGDPGLPEASGQDVRFRLRYVYDGQDSPVVPSRGTYGGVNFTHTTDAPDAPGLERTNDGLSQMEGTFTTFWSRGRQNRVFLVGAGGTSFDDKPLPTSQFTVGFPLRLDAFDVGERRGDHYAVATVGYLRQIARLPDFMGGPAFAGLWIENGALWNTGEDADFNTQLGVGVILDTLLGPVVLGAGVGLDGGWRTFFAVGRIVR